MLAGTVVLTIGLERGEGRPEEEGVRVVRAFAGKDKAICVRPNFLANPRHHVLQLSGHYSGADKCGRGGVKVENHFCIADLYSATLYLQQKFVVEWGARVYFIGTYPSFEN